MNRIIWILLGALMWVSCDKEDDLTPSGAKDDYFTLTPSDTVNNPLNALRYRFYEENRVHLMFNDTLRREDRGTYADGTPYVYTETIDFSYSMEGTPGTYRWEYVTDFDEQKKSTAFVEKYILPHLGGVMSPYSVFLVKDLEKYNSYWDSWDVQSYYSGMRCFVLNVAKALVLDEEERISKFSDTLFYNIVYNKIYNMAYTEKEKILGDFWAVSSRYHGDYYKYWYEELGWEDKTPTLEELYELGFIKGYSGSFPYDSTDWRDFLQKIFYWYEDVTFEAYYAEYPLILKKYELLKKVVEDLGYKFNVE